MSNIYYVSIAAIVAAFYGKEALAATRSNSINTQQRKEIRDNR